MLRNMKSLMATVAVLLFVSLSGVADTQFRVRKMGRSDVPLGKGQCDIRLRIDNEAEISVRGDTVHIRTLSGRNGRDDGSECNEPMPDRNLEGFNFEVRDRRGDIVLLDEPSRRNGFRAIVRIRDSEGGEGRYHFRLTWQVTGGQGYDNRRDRDRYDRDRYDNDRYGGRRKY